MGFFLRSQNVVVLINIKIGICTDEEIIGTTG